MKIFFLESSCLIALSYVTVFWKKNPGYMRKEGFYSNTHFTIIERRKKIKSIILYRIHILQFFHLVITYYAYISLFL